MPGISSLTPTVLRVASRIVQTTGRQQAVQAVRGLSSSVKTVTSTPPQKSEPCYNRHGRLANSTGGHQSQGPTPFERDLQNKVALAQKVAALFG